MSGQAITDLDYPDNFIDDTADRYQCNLCLDSYDFEELGKCPYKLCPNDHYYHGYCVEQYIRNQSDNFVHAVVYYPQDMCMTIQSRPILDDTNYSFALNCPDCRKKISMSSYNRLARSRIYEQIIKGNINDKSNLGKKINIIRRINKDLRDRIEELQDARIIYDDMILKYTEISKDYDSELIATQEKLNELNIKIDDNKQLLLDLETKKASLINSYKKDALDEVKNKLAHDKLKMEEELKRYKDKCDKEIKRYKKIKHDEYDSYLDLHRRIYLQKTKICEEDYRKKEYELMKAEDMIDKEIELLKLELDTRKDNAVWEYIQTNDMLDEFIALAREKEKEIFDKEREIKMKAMNDAIDKRREELLANLSK